jgi:GAF domain-containing protein
VKEPVIYDEIGYEVEDGIYRNVPNLAHDAEEKMKTLSAKVIFPLGSSGSIRGVLVLGQKEADYPYTTQELNFIKSVSNATSLAVERALLYREVQQFAETLQVKVNEATAELKKTNTELESALVALQEARRQERDMIDVMGHELRTPISIVRNALAMLSKLHNEGEPLDPANTYSTSIWP